MTARLAALLALPLLAAHLAAQQACGTFVSTPVPEGPDWWEAEFHDVTTLPDGTAWASGEWKRMLSLSQIETFTLAMHWDGEAWTQVPTPSPSPYPGGTEAMLHAVGAVAPDDVWAAGEARGDAGGLSVGAWILVEHWDGSSWEVVPSPPPPGGVSINFSGTRVYDIVALAADDVWFGGLWGEPNAQASVTWRPLAMHWDGSDLQVHATPAPYEAFYGFHIVDMSAVAPDDIWAVCNRNVAGGHAQALVILHWDGDSWDLVDVDNAGGERVLYAVEAIASDDVWIFGEDHWPAGPQDVFALHFDGSGWTEITGAPPARGTFALGPDAIYAGAGYNIGHGIALFDGGQWTTVEPFAGLNVHAFDGERGPGCSGWIVGREMVGGKKPFAARLAGEPAPSPWSPLAGGIAGTNGLPGLHGEGPLLGGTTAQLTLGGALAGSPATLVLGLSELQLPFKGGVLVPAPDVLVSGLVTDASGNWAASFTWPSGVPTGLALTFQAWLPDPAAVAGLAASDGLRATQP